MRALLIVAAVACTSSTPEARDDRPKSPSEASNLVVSPSGELVVSDRAGGRVYAISRDGKKRVLAGTGKPSGGGAGSPAIDSALPGVRAVWFGPGGGMFLGTHESSRLWYVGKNGLLQRLFATSDVSEVRGLSLDRHGNLIVVENDHGFVRRAARARR